MKVCPVCGKEYSDTTTLCSDDAAILQRTGDPLVGQTLAGKYRIEKLIKSGGMGSVYRGKHVLMDKTVAIKVLRPSLAVDNAVVARFSREAKAASKISHPHAVSVTDFGEAENGVVFLVMEYLDGRTLKEVIHTEGAFTLDRTVEIVRQVAGALDAAHGQGVVHRDLKSENIMLVRHNGDEWSKVLDFGIAKIQQPQGFRDVDITEANLVVGTPQYMSPEQCSQTGPLDHRSDIYSLGIIIYEMLAGRVPFTGESPTVIMMKQVQDAPPSVLSARPDLPLGIDVVLKRALAKQPLDRFQTAGDLAAALTAIAAGDTANANALASAPITVANQAVNSAADDADEVTLVTPRDEETVVGTRREEVAYAPAAPPPVVARFNPWRVMIPAVIVLVAVFAIVYALTRTSGQAPVDQTQGQQGLTSDPNSQSVRPAGSPTGEGERDIHPVTIATPAPVATPAGTNTNNKQPTEIPAKVNGNFGSNENTNSGQANRNTGLTNESPRKSPPPEARPSPTVKTIPKSIPQPTPELR